MAQINMTIVAESAEELRNVLVDLANIVEAAGLSETAPATATAATGLSTATGGTNGSRIGSR